MSEYNEGHQTEQLQTLTMIQSLIEEFVVDHPAIKECDMNDVANDLSEAVADLYQVVGSI